MSRRPRRAFAETPRVDAPLTSRQLDVMRRVAQGMTNAEAAHDLGVGVQAVKNSLTLVYARTNTVNRVSAVLALDDLTPGWRERARPS